MGAGRSSRAVPVMAVATVAAALAACTAGSAAGTVTVLYAGSLATVMEDGVGPAFTDASGYDLAGEAHGSLGAARLIREGLRRPDVFVSADPSVNQTVLMGEENHHLVDWFVTVASSQLVLAYSPRSRFAADFEAATAGTRPWYEVLEEPGLRFGRGDPAVDPKGYRTILLFELAAEHYGRPEVAALLGEADNPDQVMPEVALLARVESGQLDAGVFYEHEVVAHELPYVALPPEINLGDARFAARYARVGYEAPTGERLRGAPILFTVAIPTTVTNRAGAEAFVRFLLTSTDLLDDFGFGPAPHLVGGDIEQVPADLRRLVVGAYEP